MKSIDQADIEEVFFNYYEGNLNENEKTALFSFLDKNPALYQDFTLWKDSYVHEPLPAKDALESKLIKQEKVPYRLEKSSAYKLAAFLGAIAFLWWNIGDNVYKSNTQVESTSKTEAPAASNPFQKTNTIGLKKSISNATKIKQVQSVKDVNQLPLVLISDSADFKEEKLESLKTKIATIASNDSIWIRTTAMPLENHDAESSSTPQSIQLSKKELRKIEKAKERSKIRRQEQEFLKGNQPYVVPIDPSRF